MTASREQQLYEIFRTACEMDEEERALYLTQACSEDPALRTDVDRLLAEDTADPGFLETPALATPLPQMFAAGEAPPPERIGPAPSRRRETPRKSIPAATFTLSGQWATNC